MATKKSKKNTIHNPDEKNLKNKMTVSSLKLFAFSPKKTRSHVKIQYESTESSNISPTLLSSPSTSTSKNVKKILKTKPTASTNLIKEGKKFVKEQTNNDVSPVSSQSVAFKRKSPNRSSNIEKCDQDSSKAVRWEPSNWQKVFNNLKIMRETSLAPVDTMGCDKCSDTNADDKTKRFQILVALMLSSQTRDQVTYEAMNRLKNQKLTPENIVQMNSTDLEELLKPVSFYKNKAKYLQKASKILIQNFDCDIPKTIDELIALPGVGPKMAHICMNSAWNIVTGIGVDVHVHRISNRLGWVKKATKAPEDTRKELESWLPYEYWTDVNHLMVGFGQTVCTPINPKCDVCMNKGICLFAGSHNNSKKKK